MGVDVEACAVHQLGDLGEPDVLSFMQQEFNQSLISARSNWEIKIKRAYVYAKLALVKSLHAIINLSHWINLRDPPFGFIFSWVYF